MKVSPGNNYDQDLMNIYIETINLIYFIFLEQILSVITHKIVAVTVINFSSLSTRSNGLKPGEQEKN